MFHTKYIADTNVCSIPREEFELRKFLSEHKVGISHAAVLLAGRRGGRLVDAIYDGLRQPGSLTRRMRRLLLELHSILLVVDAHRNPNGEFGFLTMLEPEDPVVAELCLLADGLNDALSSAGIIPDANESGA